jgi:PAS domain S-box-containing protein
MTFQLKLLLAMMVLVIGVAATTLFITENQVRLSYERHFQQSFTFQVGSFLEQREARLDPIRQRVGAGASSTRLLAAMENAVQARADQRDIDDLYQNGIGIDQLSEVITASQGTRTNRGFYFFLNTKGEVLYPNARVKLPFALSGLRRIAHQVEAVALSIGRDSAPQVGYLAPEEEPGKVALREMVFTPIVDQVGHQKLGILGVGIPLPPANYRIPISSAIYVDNRLYSSSLPDADLKQVEQALGGKIRVGALPPKDLTVLLGDIPHQVYCEALSTGPAFPPAYQVCLYSLAEATSAKRSFRQKILVSGTVASLAALVLSWLISRSLTVPLQELVTGTMEIERGEYTAKVPVRGRDELGRLARAFNAMSERIQASYAALEQRIAERTHELTERKRAEAALRTSEASLREAQRIAHLGNWDWQVPANELRWSDEVYSIFGLAPLQFGATYESFLERVHPADRELVRQAVRRSLETAKPYSLEHRVIRPDGEVRVVREQAEVFRGDSGEVARMVGTVQDITEQKRIEAEFLRAQRMDSIGALAGGMAHDLNNALSPILMGVQLIRRRIQDAETQQMLRVIETNTHRGADMVRQVLTFARGREGDRELLDVGRILREMEHIARQTMPKTIEVSVLAPPDLWPVVGNPTQLHQILLNLCINARDAMPEGGQLTLAADNVDLSAAEAQSIPNAIPGAYVMMLVSDTGTGIAPEILPRLFEPFFSTKGPGQGTGLGLSTVARIVRNHGGFVSVKSELKVGSTFEIYFPRAETEPAPAPRPATHQLPRGHGEWILLLEDDRSVRDMVASSLGEYGYCVASASTGAEARTLLREHERDLRLILTVPSHNGSGALQTICANCPGAPVILMSGEIESPTMSPGEGAVAYLSKPFSLENLLNTVAKALQPKPRSTPDTNGARPALLA